VRNAIAEAAALNDPTTDVSGVQVSRQMQSGSFAPNVRHSRPFQNPLKAEAK
jgi:hypothetical protein